MLVRRAIVGLASAIVLLDALPATLADGRTGGVWARLRRAVGMKDGENDAKSINGTRGGPSLLNRDYSYPPYGYPPDEASSWSSDGKYSPQSPWPFSWLVPLLTS